MYEHLGVHLLGFSRELFYGRLNFGVCHLYTYSVRVKQFVGLNGVSYPFADTNLLHLSQYAQECWFRY